MSEHLVLQISGMDCTACERRLSSAVRRLDGVHAASADAAAGLLEVEFDPGLDPRAVAARVVEAGFTIPEAEMRS